MQTTSGWLAGVALAALTACGGDGSSPPPTYTIGGTVSGLASGASLALLDNGADSLTVSANGSFTFKNALQSGGAYAVTVGTQPSAQTCTVTAGSGIVGSANVVSVSVKCAANVVPTYTIGGTVSGLGAASGLTLVDGGANPVTVTANGSFTFSGAVANGTSYAVTVLSFTPGQACSVSNGTGTVGTADVADIAVTCVAGTETVLHSFGSPSGTDGQNPFDGLIFDREGNLYGTTFDGGTNGTGIVYEITTSGIETVLYDFGPASGTDGQHPDAGVTFDSAGNLYGMTVYGGANGGGTVFKLAPTGSGAYTESVLHSFGSGTDGERPQAGVTLDSAGNIFGTTSLGGTNGTGTVFEITTDGSERVLYDFGPTSGTDGQQPYATVILDSAGAIYGTTISGGTAGGGTVYELTPAGDGTYTESVLHRFGSSAGDGQHPQAQISLILDAAGNLYGTTYVGGTNGTGTVFKLTPSGEETVLYSFGGTSSTDGQDPDAIVTFDSAGNLYGTTTNGGTNGTGTVFKLTPAGVETTLYNFGPSTGTDGQNPHAEVVSDSAGNLYGTTLNGGAYGHGTVFKLD
jgi:uncharacterized repeat protein (TIGR03803 family)